MNKSISDSLFNSIKALIENAKSHTIRSVNARMVFIYFHIGRLIVEKEQGGRERAIYAKQNTKVEAPFNFTELASSLATVELLEGSTKKAGSYLIKH